MFTGRATRLNTKQPLFHPHGVCTVHIPYDYVKKLNFPVLQLLIRNYEGWFTHSMPFPCRAHAVPLPCCAARGLECVFPILFTQCGRVWFTLAMPCPCHAPTMPFFSRPKHSTAVERLPCCAVALRRTAWSEHGMGMAWQVWIRHGRTVYCVNKMGKTHSKPLAAQHGRGTAWVRHGHGMICVNQP